MQEKKKTLKKRKGFLLLELIIVVAIIGILAAVAISNLVGMTDEAKVAKIQSDLSTIGTAMEVYHVKKGGEAATRALNPEPNEGKAKSTSLQMCFHVNQQLVPPPGDSSQSRM